MEINNNHDQSQRNDMARLSAPASEPPKAERKPNRLRSIFKPSSSSSSSFSSTASSKRSPTAHSGPLPSPTVKHGFQQIGLLPSERPSYTFGQRSPWAKQASEETTNVDAKEEMQESESANAGLFAGAKSKDAGVYTEKTFAPWSQQSQAENTLSPWLQNTLFPATVSTSDQNVATSQNHSSIFGNSQPRSNRDSPRMFGNLLGKRSAMNTNQSEVNKHEEGIITSPDEPRKQMSHDWEMGNPFGQKTNGFTNTVARTNAPSPFRPAHDGSSSGLSANIVPVDKEYQLEKGFRDYVVMKVAEAFAQQSNEKSATGWTKQQRAAHAKFNMLKTNTPTSAKITKPDSREASFDMFSGESGLGPFTISHPRVARVAQSGIIAVYAIFVLGAALLGPRTLLLTLWRVFIGLGAYALLVRYLDWAKHVECDMLLAPVVFAGNLAHGAGVKILEKVRAFMISVIVASLQGLEEAPTVQVEDNQSPFDEALEHGAEL